MVKVIRGKDVGTAGPEVLPSYSEAVAAIRLMADPNTEPNDIVRFCARGMEVVATAFGSLDLPRSSPEDLLGLRTAIRMIRSKVDRWQEFGVGSAMEMVGPVLDRFAGVENQFMTHRPTGHVPEAHTVAVYDRLPVEGAPTRVLDPGLREALVSSRLGSYGDDSPISPEELDMLQRLVPMTAYTLIRVKCIMGPRTEAVMRSLGDEIDRLPQLFDSVVHSGRVYLASPSSDTLAQFRSSMVDLALAPAMSMVVCVSDRKTSWPYTRWLQTMGCSFAMPTEFLRPLLNIFNRASDLHKLLTKAEDPDSKLFPGDVSLLQGDDIRREVDGWVRKAAWHLARSRRSPGLWR